MPPCARVRLSLALILTGLLGVWTALRASDGATVISRLHPIGLAPAPLDTAQA